jgi:hypothetical protein
MVPSIYLNGQSVHKELEREICGEEMPVKITTNEERWAVRCGMSSLIQLT